VSTQAGEPTEEQLRAYEEELSRITSAQLVVQAVASLLNVGAHRLGVGEDGEQERDLEQVRDAIDGVMALLPIIERRLPAAQARPLRDALSQLQMAYARAAQAQPAPEAQAPPADAANAGDADSASKGPGPAERSGRLWVPGR
jgi:Domain of unknown function (DUF1844)